MAENVLDVWQSTVSRLPDKPAAIWEGTPYTYRHLDELIRNMSSSLVAELGIGPGDKVALLMPNCIEFVVAYLSILRTGAVALPVNIRLKSPEIQFILEDAGASCAIVHEKVWPEVQSILKELQGLKGLISVGFEEEGAIPLGRMVAKEPQGFEPACPKKTDVAAIIYTSGTTGRPKGAMLTHDNLIFNAQSCVAAFGFQEHEVHLLVVPLFHVTGLNTILVTSILVGSTLVISARPMPQDILGLIERHRVNTFFGVPTTYVMFAGSRDAGQRDVSSARLFVYSGAPMPPETILKLREMFPRIHLVNLYGLTETTSITTVLPSEEALKRMESVGRPVPHLELKVIDERGLPLGPGQIGELCVRSRSVFAGYLKRPEATQEAFLDGWFRTGDLALRDEEGYVFLKGRKKEMIIVAGENVYPVEVENVLASHAGVLEAAVVGIPHAVLGQVVKAVLVPKAGAQISELEIKRHCSERLASFKVPQRVQMMDALPRNPSGKVVKRLIED